MIRGMSFAMQKNRSPYDKEVEEQVLRKVSYLVKMCEDADIIYAHENCMNYGGQSHEHTLNLLEKIKSPNFKIIFDTGNPQFTDMRIGEGPYKKQSAWEFYQNIKDFIYYVHIKDAVFIEDQEGVFGKSRFTWPGEGEGFVKEIVGDLKKRGYNGGYSIEPHVAHAFHEAKPDVDMEKIKYDSYVEYGHRFIKLYNEA